MSTIIPLHRALKRGRLNKVKRILKNTNVNLQDSHGVTPLMLASVYGHLEIVEILLENKNINVNLRNQHGETALFDAYMIEYEKNNNIIKVLLENEEINVNLPSLRMGNMTVLHIACLRNDSNMIEKLLNNKSIDVNIQDDNGDTALHFIYFHSNWIHVLRHPPEEALDYSSIVKKFLENKSIDINLKNFDNRTILNAACRWGDYDSIEALLNVKNIDIDSPDIDGVTPFCNALRYGNLKIVKLLETKKNIQIDFEGFKELVECLHKFYRTIIRMLSHEYGGRAYLFYLQRKIDILRSIDFMLCKYTDKKIKPENINKILNTFYISDSETLADILNEALTEMSGYNQRYGDELKEIAGLFKNTKMIADPLNIIQSFRNDTTFKNQFLNVHKIHVYCDICGKLKD